MRFRAVFHSAFLALFLTILCGAALGAAPEPWDAPVFTASPAELAKAASAVDSSKGFDATVLLDQREIQVDENGSTRERFHLVYRVNSDAGVQSWSSTGLLWEPWHQKRPVVRARVITADGVEHVLDPKTLSDTPARENASDIYSDTRSYRGPLPAVAIGAVVEEEITIEDTAPTISGGTVERMWIGRRVPVSKVRLVLRAPSTVPLKYDVRVIPNATIEKTSADGFTQIKIEAGPLDAIERSEPDLPSDVFSWPQVELSTFASWQQVAKAYKEMSEPQIRVDDVRKLVDETVAPGDSRADKIRKLTAKLHQIVRYTGIEFGESKLVPQPPSEVMNRKYGDCKDKATMLAAMLRAAGIPAYLALLNAGGAQDVSPSLPGGGLFNHAIVFVPGKPDMWIDATDEFSPAGQLATGDQGRRALIIRDQTTGLQTTPISTSADNLLVENREFYLSEYGPARVVEQSESHGNIDRSYRSYYGTNRDSKQVQKEMEDYVKSAYLSENLTAFERGDGTDLAKPFLFRLEASKAKRGQTSLRDAQMAILPAGVVGRLPEYFKKSDEDLSKERAKTIKPVLPRTDDYVLPVAFITEWRYKIVPPPGFKVRALPESRTQDMGPAKYSQTYTEGANGVVNAVLRFDTVKTRYTVAEAEALRKAVVEFRKSNAIIIAFDQVGYSLLSAGKTREAITAFDDLVKQHPKEALHHIQIADGLLEAGLGEAARAEAEQAVELEPNSAVAHRTYGWILQHDLVGRRFKKGFDLPGAIAQYRKALELEPDGDDARIDCAILLEHDADGERYSERADIKGAVEQYRELKKRKSTWSSLDTNLLFALYYSQQFTEVEALASTLELDSMRIPLVIAARAASEGADSGLKKSLEVTSDEKARMEALVTAANELLNLRLYKPAAELLAKINTGQSSLDTVNAIQKTQRYESLPTSEKDASSFVFKMLTLVTGPKTADPKAAEMFLKGPEPKKKPVQKTDPMENIRSLGRGIRNLAAPDLSQEIRGDVFLSNANLTAEGDDKTGYRVIVQGLSLNGFSFYVVKEQGRFRLLPYDELMPFMGRIALARLQADDVAGARKWLDWAREEQTINAGDDPLAGPAFPRLWRKGQNADKETCERVAASLLSYSEDVEPYLPVLLAGREHARDEMQRTAFDLALFRAYSTLERWQEARQASERLLQASADSVTAFKSYAYASIELKDWKAAEKAANQRLETNAEDQDAIEVLQDIADRQNKLGESINIIRKALKTAKPRPSLLNNYAWNSLFLPPVPDDAVEAAQRATRLTDNKDFGVTHTLAALYAEVGRVGEARQLLLQIMDGTGLDEPNSAVWYVFGRIAEQYGRKQAALSAYRRVEKDDEGEPRPNSTYILAQKGIGRLGAAGSGVTTGAK